MTPSTQQQGFILRLLLVIILVASACVWALRALVLPPSGFPVDTTFAIEEGDSLGGVAYRLQQDRYIKSPEAFKVMMLALGTENHLTVGEYYFEAPITSVEVALKLSGREFGILQHRVTFPEGFTTKDMAARLGEQFEGFDQKAFLSLAAGKEGYLFPDTYSFSPTVAPASVIAALEANFMTKTIPLEQAFAASARSKKDVIVMASIVEKEANGKDDAAVIAGILWNRIDKGIALQVDAPFYYLIGKTSKDLTAVDLAMKSPFNTYLNRGLPPAPISNPGIAAIEAALTPATTPYLYYLHDADGGVHYASTYQEHLANKQTYLP